MFTSAGTVWKVTIPVAQDCLSIIRITRECEIDLGFVHLRMIRDLPDEPGDDVAFSVVYRLAGTECDGFRDVATVAQNVLVCGLLVGDFAKDIWNTCHPYNSHRQYPTQ